jgi:hypothetical protein
MASLHDFYMKWFPGEINHLHGFHAHLQARMPDRGKLLDLGCGNNALLARYRTTEREVWGATLQTIRNCNTRNGFVCYMPMGPSLFRMARSMSSRASW